MGTNFSEGTIFNQIQGGKCWLSYIIIKALLYFLTTEDVP